MPFSMHFSETPGSSRKPKRGGSGWRGDALILALCVIALLLADLFAAGGRNTRAVIGGVGELFQRGSTVVADLSRR